MLIWNEKKIHIPVISNEIMCLLTEQKAEWRQAGWEGPKQIQQTYIGVPDKAVVVCWAFFATQLQKPSFLWTVLSEVRQCSHKRLKAQENSVQGLSRNFKPQPCES